MNNINGFIANKSLNIPSRIKNYKIEKLFCTLTNSYLFVATNINIIGKVFIKVYDKEIIQYDPEQILLINNEIFILKIINHKNCLKLYEIIETPSFIFLVMEYVPCHKLIDYINNNNKKLTEDEAINIYKQIISVLIYFHEMKIGHLNINLNDIIIDNNNDIKLCEFDYSVFYSNEEKIKWEIYGDKNYIAPEFFIEKACYPEKADIWSSGVLLYFLIIGQLPFKGINDFDLQNKIMNAEFSLPVNLNKNLKDFFKNIFEVKIELRYNLEKILNSPLFREKKINKNNLQKGFNILTTKYPIDERVMNICNTYYNIDIENLKQKLYKNIFDPQTSLYKQIISYFSIKVISSESDLKSKKFNYYINNDKHLLKAETKNNNIQRNLSKFEEIKKENPNQKKLVEEKQNKALIKLEELLEKCKNSNFDKIETNENPIENDLNKDKNINISHKKRRSMDTNSMNQNTKRRSSFVFINKLNININIGKRRRSTVVNNNIFNFNNNLDKLNSKERNKKENKNNKISNKVEIIKESEEENIRTVTNNNSKSNSSSSSRSSSKKKETKINKKNDNTNKSMININKNKKKNSIVSSNSNNNIVKEEKKKVNAVKSTAQITKNDFFSQIKGVKLKKYTPNTYANPDEIKKKPKEGNKNALNIEHSTVSLKDAKSIFEENIKNSQKNKNKLISHQKKANEPKIQLKNNNSKEYPNQKKANEQNSFNKINSNKKKARKSINYSNALMFKNKGIMLNRNELNKENSKDDTIKLKNKYKNDMMIIEEELDEIVIPKENKKTEINEEKIKDKEKQEIKKKEIEEQKKKEELKLKKKEEEELRLKQKKEKEKELRLKKQEEEIRLKKEAEELILKQKEEELRKKQEEEEEIRLKKEAEEIRLKKEAEELRKKQEEELRLKQKEEEEKKRKELEEQEMEKKKREEEERKLKEEERKLKEKERKLKEKEEKELEEKRLKEEARIRKEKEKQRIKLEEEEKLRKWKEEKRIEKEKEEKRKKEEEQKERKKEEEKRKKIKEETEQKRKEEKEQNKKRFEEYEKMIKEKEENKKIMESMKKQKEEELKKKREIEWKEKNQIKEKNKNVINDNNTENKSAQNKENNRRITLKSMPFGIFADDIKNENISFKKKKNSQILLPNRKRKELNESDNESVKDKENKIKKRRNKSQIELTNNFYGKSNSCFFTNHTQKNANKNEQNESINNQQNRIFYHYQHSQENKNKDNRNNMIKTIPPQIITNFINNDIPTIKTFEDYPSLRNSVQKRYKKLKVKTKQENSYKKNDLCNNIQPIKIKKESYNFSTEKPIIKDFMTELNDTGNKIKSNNAFKKINRVKLFLNPQKMKKIRKVSNISIDFNNNKTNKYSELDMITKIPDSQRSEKIIKRKNKNDTDKKKNKYNESNSSFSSDKDLNQKNKFNNMTYRNKSVIFNKEKNFTKVSDYISNSNKTKKTIIKIKRNSQLKDSDIVDKDLQLYKGEIDYNNVSLKNIKESIDYLINKYKDKGYKCIKKEKTKFKFNKGMNSFTFEIMKLGNGLLYYNEIK